MTNKLATYQIQIKQFYGKDRTLPCDFFNLIFTFFLFVFFLNLDFILPQNTQVRLVAFYSIPQIFLFLRQKLTTTKYPRHEFFFRGGERRTGSVTLIYKYTLHKDAVLAVLALPNCHGITNCQRHYKTSCISTMTSWSVPFQKNAIKWNNSLQM